jgi:hypothetical protein
MALTGAGCTSGTMPAAVAHVTTTTTTAPILSTASTPGGAGTSQTATGATGQRVTATPTHPGRQGLQFGGPPGSWDLGLIVENMGPGVFQSVPASQIALVDASGRSYAPVVMDTALTGLPSALPATGQLRMLLVFPLPAGDTPVAVTFVPVGASGPTLHWTA